MTTFARLLAVVALFLSARATAPGPPRPEPTNAAATPGGKTPATSHRPEALIQEEEGRRMQQQNMGRGAGSRRSTISGSSRNQIQGRRARSAAAGRSRQVPDQVLGSISSVECLMAKHKDPGFNCTRLAPGRSLSGGTSSFLKGEELRIGNYPDLHDPQCHWGEDEVDVDLCDPDLLLSQQGRRNVSLALKWLREKVSVPCAIASDRVEKPFRLGIALARRFPLAETNQDTLEEFGTVTMARWNLMKMPKRAQSSTPCPNAAVLTVLLEPRLPVLSTVSCEFICGQRGGDEVLTRVRTGLNLEDQVPRDEALAEALLGGIEELAKVLRTNAPVPGRAGPTRMPEGRMLHVEETYGAELFQKEASWTAAMQAIFGLCFSGSLLVIYLCFAGCVAEVGPFRGKTAAGQSTALLV